MRNTVITARESPKTNVFLKILEKSSNWSAIWFERIAMVGIVGIILATLVDVLGAKLFHKPMEAGTEVVYFLQIIAIAGALAFAQVDGRHVRLEFIDSAPKYLSAACKFITSLLGLGLFVLLAWESLEYGQTLRAANEVTAASRFPIFPFAIWIGISCIPLCLVLLNSMVKSVAEVIKK